MKWKVALVVLLIVHCAQAADPDRVIDANQIQERGELLYERSTGELFTGLAVANHPDGMKVLEIRIVNGKPESFSAWHPNGQKRRVARVSNGVPTGTWTDWEPDGRIKVQVKFVDGTKQGTHISWYDNGQKAMESNFICWIPGEIVAPEEIDEKLMSLPPCRQATFKMMFEPEWREDGEPRGLQTQWYENGQKASESVDEIFYLSDGWVTPKCDGYTKKCDGDFTKWYENGNKQEQRKTTKKKSRKGSLETVVRINWYENGNKQEQTTETTKYVKKSNEYESTLEVLGWHPNGKRSSHVLNNGFEDVRHEWDESGRKITEIRTENLKETGFSSETVNGERVETNYVDGKRHGLQTRWSYDGKKVGEVNFIEDVPDGIQTDWHSNGQMKSQVTWSNGLPAGDSIHWHENGQVSRKDKVIDGRGAGYLSDLDLALIRHSEKGEFFDTEHVVVSDKDTILVTAWHPNGQKSAEGAYIYRGATFVVSSYDDKRKEFLMNPLTWGVEAGIHTTWHDNGQKRAEKEFVVRLGHFPFRENRCQGALCSTAEGVSRSWDEDGQLEEEVCYLFGMPTSSWPRDWADDPEKVKIEFELNTALNAVSGKLLIANERGETVDRAS